MNRARKFEVAYEIDSSEWERSAERRREQWAVPVVHAFRGNLNLGSGDAKLFVGDVRLSVADFACQAAIRLRSGVAFSSEGWIFEELDGARHINFTPADGFVQVTSDVPQSVSMKAVGELIETGLRSFVSRFSRDVTDHIPGALEWKDLSELKGFA